jgi:hypothetical protein
MYFNRRKKRWEERERVRGLGVEEKVGGAKRKGKGL